MVEKDFQFKNTVEEIVSRSGLAKRSLGRRFLKATGYSPIVYVQNLRIEKAKYQVERTKIYRENCLSNWL
jgi:transcriptional regulator GlxA family with amidase domain